MKKLLALALLIVLSCTMFSACGQQQESTDTINNETTQGDEDVSTPKEQSISSIYDYNKDSETDSHKDEWQNSHLELSFRDRVYLDHSSLATNEIWYPRVKQLANGEYILLYMNGVTGNHIYISRSKDLKKWYGTERLFEGSAATSSSPLYASADAIVLQNGDIIAAAGFRGYKTYKTDVTTDGIRIRRSTDNGVTWSEPETVYIGGVWEPSLLQLKSGEIQMFWTNTHIGGSPASMGGRTDDNSTGTAMLRSFDNGYTWTNDITVPYKAQVVAQQFTKTGSDGKYYSGQMPVAWQLNNGDIALALEVRYGKEGESGKTYNLSFAYSPGENSWPVSLGAEEEGPTSLIKNMYLKGAGPYIRQFKSGETVLSYHWGTDWFTLVGNSTATKFNERTQAFGSEVKTSIWGSTEIIGSHTMLGTVPTSITNKDANGKGFNSLYIGKFNLNHTITSKTKDITVDGYLDDWTDVDQAFFVGSETQAQAAIRVCEDADNIYFAAEVLDYYITADDKLSFLVGSNKTSKYLNVAVSAEGKITVNKGGIKIDKSQVEAAVYVNGTIDDNKEKDSGYIIELKLPKSVFSGDDTLIFNPVLYNKDKENESTKPDSIGNLSLTNIDSWLKIKLAAN